MQLGPESLPTCGLVPKWNGLLEIAAAAVVQTSQGPEFAPCPSFARDQAMSDHGWASPYAEGRRGVVQWRSGKLPSCSCWHSRGRCLRAVPSRRSRGDHRRWASARRRPRSKPRRSGGHRSHSHVGWPQRRESTPRSRRDRQPPNQQPRRMARLASRASTSLTPRPRAESSSIPAS